MSAPIIAMDTETTGLSLDDEIWEFAAIRRESDGGETELHLFIEHSVEKCARLPESFLADHRSRYISDDAVPTSFAVQRIVSFFHGPECGGEKPHVVGAVPNFDTERLLRLIHRHHYLSDLPWHYHLIDVENLVVGWLAHAACEYPGSVAADQLKRGLPWDSNDLSLSVGVDPKKFERHTALGDARWALAIYDAVMGGAS